MRDEADAGAATAPALEDAESAVEIPEGPPTHVVTRPFEGSGGRQYQTGELVDASTWKHTERLVPRHLRPLGQSPTPDAERILALEAKVAELGVVVAALSARLDQLQPKKKKEVQDGGST
jgi:hypothetical protein